MPSKLEETEKFLAMAKEFSDELEALGSVNQARDWPLYLSEFLAFRQVRALERIADLLQEQADWL